MDKILFVPNPLLRHKANKIKKVTNNEILIAKKMRDIMNKAPGVGLAANQIGILKEIVTVSFVDQNTKNQIEYSLFNPNIISYSKEKVVMEEGCLSLPNQFAEIERSEKITLEYLDEKNSLVKKQADGIEARILQHEIDHLSGKLFVDYLSPLKKNILIKKVQKFLKNKK